MIDIDGMLKLTLSQGHKVKCQGHIYALMKKYCFGYKSWTDWWTLMTLTYTFDIDESLELTQGQGHKVKGQGHICSFVNSCFGYKSLTDDIILMILTYMIFIYER